VDDGYEVIAYIPDEGTICRTLIVLVRGGRVKDCRRAYHIVRGTLDAPAWKNAA